MSLRQEIPIDRLFLSEKALEDLPGREILAGADGILARLSRDVEEVAKRFDEALARADEGIAKIRWRWNERKQEVQRAYEKILRELQKSAVDGEEFIRLRKEIEGLRPLRERRLLLRRLADEHMERRRTLLAEWEDLKAEEFRLLDRAAKRGGQEAPGPGAGSGHGPAAIANPCSNFFDARSAAVSRKRSTSSPTRKSCHCRSSWTVAGAGRTQSNRCTRFRPPRRDVLPTLRQAY